MLILGVVGILFFGGLALFSNLYPNETVTWYTTSGFLLFCVLSGALILGYFREKHQVTDDGIRSVRTFLGPCFIPWEDVESIRYAERLKWFKIRSTAGEVTRVSAVLVGLSDFAAFALRHVPSGAVDKETLSILEDTVNGTAPNPWL
ncbi:PH domain-containing protein [Roseibacillus persicicus]|uniref:PH domain-containing protein n=1 Tax=Roseibacillus persicicus TaxID=454148 RepID=UPI003CE467EA